MIFISTNFLKFEAPVVETRRSQVVLVYKAWGSSSALRIVFGREVKIWNLAERRKFWQEQLIRYFIVGILNKIYEKFYNMLSSYLFL